MLLLLFVFVGFGRLPQPTTSALRAEDEAQTRDP